MSLYLLKVTIPKLLADQVASLPIDCLAPCCSLPSTASDVAQISAVPALPLAP